MSLERDIDLVNELLTQPSEVTWLEFKKNNTEPDLIGKYCSALSNSACVEGRDYAYILWGIEDDSRKIVGTTFNPDTQTIGNQVLPMWLAQRLQPSIAFSFRRVSHPDGNLILLEIPAATGTPVCFNGIPHIRIGNTTPKLTDYPERYQQLIERMRPYRWEQGIAKQYVDSGEVLKLLDYSHYFQLSKQPLPDNRDGILERLEAERLIAHDVGDKWNVTNLGAILFANRLADFGDSLARKAIRFIAYDGKNRASAVKHRHDGQKGYAIGFQGLVGYLNDLLPKNEHIGAVLRETRPMFPELAIRELVANALIHQDLTISGAGPQIELFTDRIEISNPGKPLVKPDRMIDLPPRSRNESLAGMMRRLGFCEEQGSGLDKVIEVVEFYQLPPPLFRVEDHATQVILYGPRTFAYMTPDERIRACYFHAVLKFLSGDKMKNATLCARLGIPTKNAAQTSIVINKTLEAQLIRVADPEHPRGGYVPHWA